MGKKKTDDETDDKDVKGGKGGLVKTIGLAVAFAVLGAFAGPKVLGSSAPAGAAVETTTTTVAGPLVVLDKVTLNLSDGRLLQVGLALELSSEHAKEAKGGGGHGKKDDGGTDDPTKGYAKALDAAIEVLSGESMASLSAAGGRQAAKAALNELLAERYHGQVVDVYFHTFVMQ